MEDEEVKVLESIVDRTQRYAGLSRQFTRFQPGKSLRLDVPLGRIEQPSSKLLPALIPLCHVSTLDIS